MTEPLDDSGMIAALDFWAPRNYVARPKSQ